MFRRFIVFVLSIGIICFCCAFFLDSESFGLASKTDPVKSKVKDQLKKTIIFETIEKSRENAQAFQEKINENYQRSREISSPIQPDELYDPS